MTSTSSSPTTPTPESVVSSNHRRSSDLQNVLIVGATGVIGTYITEAIVTHKAELGRVAVLTSKETLKDKIREIAALESGGVDVFVGLLDDEETVKDAYRGKDEQALECGCPEDWTWNHCLLVSLPFMRLLHVPYQHIPRSRLLTHNKPTQASTP